MSFRSLLEHFYITTGIVFKDNRDVIERKVQAFYEEKGFKDYHDFFTAVKKDRTLYQELINLLTTSETYFYRELSQIQLFISYIQEKEGPIKILCAPCASGEEPFSLLIAMLEAHIDINKIEIYGIDINTNEIDKAIAGVYTHRRLYQLSDTLQSKYFTRLDNNHYKIIPKLQKHVHFKQMNIFDPFPQGFDNFDVIFSRNMLIYFDKQAQEMSERVFYEKLRNGGLLFLGHADHIHHVCNFRRVSEKGVTYYQK